MANLAYRANTAQGIGRRSVQQDAVGFSTPDTFQGRGLLAVLSDGMGSLAGSERCSSMVVSAMLGAHRADAGGSDLCARLRRYYAAARRQVLAAGVEQVGSATMTAVLIWHSRCAFLAVGDSRLYLMRGGGLVQLTRDQTLGIQLDERAAFHDIPAVEAQRNLYRGGLMNHMTQESTAFDANERPFQLMPGDKLLLASDGVFAALKEDALLAQLAQPGASGAQGIINTIDALNLPKQDNYSAIVIAVCGAGREKSKRGGRK